MQPLVEFLASDTVEIYYLNNNNDNALHLAMWLGNIEVITLLSNFSNIDQTAFNNQGKTPFHLASEEILEYFQIHLEDLEGLVDIFEKRYAEELLTEISSDLSYVGDGDISKEVMKCLFECCAKKNELVVKNILKDNPAYLDYVLKVSASYGWEDMMRYALEMGANVNDRDVDGNAALNHAVEGLEGVNAIDDLLNFGADVIIENYSGYSPLDIARYNRDITDATLDRLEIVGLAQRHIGITLNALDFLNQGDNYINLDDINRVNDEMINETGMEPLISLTFLLGAIFIWPDSII